jgi:phosphoglucomutase
LFDELRPTPELSFAVRELKAFAGIVITASHNPKEYNGYKVYGEDGAQLSLEGSNLIISQIEKISDITSVDVMDEKEAKERGLLNIIGKEIDNKYYDELKQLVLNKEIIEQQKDNLKIVFTPIHGTGNKPVRRILSELGFSNVIVVKEQEEPDSEFRTVKYPNPEEKEAFNLAIKIAKENDADFIIGTDPDADRVGVLVKNDQNVFVNLTGNQTGCLLLEYILSTLKNKNGIPSNAFVIKTIVTTELAKAIAANYGVNMYEVLTGFKFIGEQILLRDEKGNEKYIFGFEESYGYLAGTHSRDKDAVVTCMLIAEMAAFYKSCGKTLYDALTEMYNKYGYYLEDITNFTLKGKEGIEKIEETIEVLRNQKHCRFGYFNVKAIRDYNICKRYDILEDRVDTLELPSSNVLYYELTEQSWFCIRPSGTEPKLKIYYGSYASSLSDSQNNLKNLKGCVLEIIEKLLYQ